MYSARIIIIVDDSWLKQRDKESIEFFWTLGVKGDL